jgi:hypothetical protein
MKRYMNNILETVENLNLKINLSLYLGEEKFAHNYYIEFEITTNNNNNNKSLLRCATNVKHGHKQPQ